MSTSSSPSPSDTPKRNFSYFTKLIVILMIGGVGGYLFAHFFKSNTNSLTFYNKLAMLPFLVAIILLVLIVHEVGHVLAGLWVGFEFRMITVGPFMLQKEGNKTRFRWNTRLNAAGGLALCLPKTEQNLKNNFIKFVAGGPIASLLFALLCLAIYYNGQTRSAQNFWLLSGTMSTMIFFTTIIPMRSKGFFSDGARILNLMKGGEDATIDLVILTTTIASSSGIRPRDLNVAPIQQILNSEYPHPFIPYLHIYMYNHWLDQQKSDKALAYLSAALEGIHNIPVGYQAMLWLDWAFHQAYYIQDISEAKKALAKAKISAVIPPHSVHKSKAAIYWAEGQHPAALQEANAALKALNQSTDKGSAIAEEEFLRSFINSLKQATD